MDLPRVTTTTYGLHSFRYAATQVWNMLPDDMYAARVFYISRVFSNDRSVLSQCNTRLRLLHLL